MSGLLDGLPTLNAAVSITDERGEQHEVTNKIAWVKRDDVREALRSDETVRAVLTETGWPETDVNARDVRAVLAALAGDDHE